MIGVISDAHGNGPALRIAIDVLKRHGAHRFIFLGDAVGYVPSLSAVNVLADLGRSVTCLRGNHDTNVIEGTPGVERESIYQHLAVREIMTSDHFAFMSSWRLKSTLDCPAGNALFVHGSPAEPTNGYVYPDTDLTTFSVAEAFVFMGHTHRPFIRQCGAHTFINVGSCGMPRDHGTLGSAATFDEDSGSIRLLRFDISRAVQEVLESHLIDPLVRAVFERTGSRVEGDVVDV